MNFTNYYQTNPVHGLNIEYEENNGYRVDGELDRQTHQRKPRQKKAPIESYLFELGFVQFVGRIFSELPNTLPEYSNEEGVSVYRTGTPTHPKKRFHGCS